MLFILFVVAAAAAAAVLTGGAGTAAETKRTATLRLVERDPLTLRGMRFRPRELVRVKVTADARTATRRVRATASGSFTSRIALPLDRCSGLLAVASGSRGSRAMLKLPQPLCPPS